MFIDSHAHIDGPEFDADRDQMLARAQQAGVTTILNVGTGNPHHGVLERAVELGKKYAPVYTALGTHPHDASHYDDKAEEKIKTLVSSEKVLAWGEIGLDFHYNHSPKDVQVSVFRRQLRAARECDLPVVIHTREAEAETIEILKSDYEGAERRGVFHCFSGSMALAKSAIELGFMISFSGIVTFKKADELRSIAAEVPLERLFIETDCPYLTPVPHRGKRNEPGFVVEVARCLAKIHGVEVEELARVTAENFRKFFRLEGFNHQDFSSV